jgi:uncharacterized protein YkwD
VRRALAPTIVLVALLVGFAVPGATSGARSSRQAAVLPDWLGPSNLGESDGRLKRVSVAAVPQPEPADNEWRQPAAAAELTDKSNAWRTASVFRPAAAEPAPAPAAAQQPADNAGDYDAAVIAATNAIRRSKGLDPLRSNQGLTAAADQHSRSMGKVGFFAHESADGSAFWKRVQNYYAQGDASYWAVGENIIWASPELSVDEAMKAWMASPGHRENILAKDWREIGCSSFRADSAPGVYSGRKVVLITCDFGVRR